MKKYLELLHDVLDNGQERKDRTGTGTLSVFGRELRFDFADGFPMITTKKVHFKSVVFELLWFISGDTNIRFLKENGVSIWDEWSDADGNLGPVYGHQWRRWKSYRGDYIDQLENIIKTIKSDPSSRRLLVNSWNVADIENMALPPCHYAYQFYVQKNRLSCIFNMRSVDVFLGLPFNIVSYALLTAMVAHICDLIPHELIWFGGDVHLYKNHLEQANIQLARVPRNLPTLRILRKPKDIFSYMFEDFVIEDYEPHPAISAPISV